MPPKTHQIWNTQFISHIIDSMADGVFTLDDQGYITSWNYAMERISGYPADEALGKTCQLLQCSRCFGKQCPASIKKCAILEHGKSEAKECLLKHKDGHTVPLIKNASVVRDDDENIIGIGMKCRAKTFSMGYLMSSNITLSKYTLPFNLCL